jgi:uncharacterized protein with HEPN domain
MTPPDLRQADYISHMLEATMLAFVYTEGLGKPEFMNDKKTQQAVILNIMVIGEAATKLSDEYPDFVTKYPQIQWKSMRGMRNRLAHGYFDINLDVVWETVKQALPELECQLRKIQQTL